jgi:hypothetical protein
MVGAACVVRSIGVIKQKPGVPVRALEELIDRDDPALPVIEACAAKAAHRVEILPPSGDSANLLSWLQVSTRSHLGSVAYATGGILIDDGWLRIIGSGHDRFKRDLRQWNDGRSGGFVLVADDVVGGFFALNSGALGQHIGGIYYWAPDTLAWESLGVGYGDFLEWTFSKGLAQFYEGLRWQGWQGDIAHINADQCLSFYPFLWTSEGSVQDSTRGMLSMAERYLFNIGLAEQLHAR